MIVLAEITDTGLTLIASAIALGWAILKLVEKIYDNRRADKAAALLASKVESVRTDTIKEAEKVATKVEQVKGAIIQTAKVADEHREEIKTALDDHNAAQAQNLGNLSNQLTTVVDRTNGILQRVEEAGIAKGRLEEKNEIKDKEHGNGT